MVTSSLRGDFNNIGKFVVTALPLARVLASFLHLAVARSESGERSIDNLALSVDVSRCHALQTTFTSELLDHPLTLEERSGEEGRWRTHSDGLVVTQL